MNKSINNFSIVLLALMLCTGLVFSGCTEEPSVQEEPKVPLTWSLDNVTEVSAVFTGRLDVPAQDLSFSKVTVCCSDAEVFNVNDGCKASTTQFDGDHKFTITVTGLKPNVKYNYCLIAEVKSDKIYGDVKDFTTMSLVAPTLNAVSEMTEVSAVIRGKVTLAQGAESDLEYGFQYSVSEDFSSEVLTTKVSEMDAEGNFSVQISSLVPSQTYYIRTYIRMNGVTVYGEVSSFSAVSLVAPTLNAVSEMTEVSAVISGKVTLAQGAVSDLEYGFQYSVSEDFSSEVLTTKVNEMDAEGNFSVQISSLVPSQTYYIRTYIRMSGVIVYGEVSSFSAVPLVAPELNEASYVKWLSATISGKVTLLSKTASDMECGLQYSTLQDFTSDVITKIVTELNPENNFSVEISGLTPLTTYYYRSYIKVNGALVYGEPKFFTTLQHPYLIEESLDVSAATDLSSIESANCYIVSETGLYKFKAVMGNSGESVGSIASAEILWESFGTNITPICGDLISGVCYKDGYIVFEVSKTFKEGNAVIAAKDADGNILWSWHIWFTDQPQGQVYYNNAGTMMDRNLGATSATPGDVGALGLLYQWGRKDPFLGSSSISSDIEAKSTVTWPSAVSSDSSNGTIAYATANPTTFIKYNSNNYDWHYTGSSSTDNTRWTTSETTKSIYDPCPAGWRVPDGGSNGVWSKALGSSSSFTDSSLYNSTNEGMNFSGKFGSASTIWYPASGYCYYRDGSLHNVGGYGFYWSASPYGNLSNNAYGLRFNYSGDVLPSNSLNLRANGYSVRCLQVID